MPGPGEYKSEESIEFLKTKKIGKNSFAFHSKIDRFSLPESINPGPG